MVKIVDLSHPIENGMITYTGMPGPKITDHLSRGASRGHYAEGTTFQIGKIEMVANTGTYIDAPFHRYGDGKDLAQFEIISTTILTARDRHIRYCWGLKYPLSSTCAIWAACRRPGLNFLRYRRRLKAWGHFR